MEGRHLRCGTTASVLAGQILREGDPGTALPPSSPCNRLRDIGIRRPPTKRRDGPKVLPRSRSQHRPSVATQVDQMSHLSSLVVSSSAIAPAHPTTSTRQQRSATISGPPVLIDHPRRGVIVQAINDLAATDKNLPVDPDRTALGQDGSTTRHHTAAHTTAAAYVTSANHCATSSPHTAIRSAHHATSRRPEGGGEDPPVAWHSLMAETGDLRACNADATVTCGDGRRDS
jgi:hypothetical protein